jgi:hypothetical protein
MIFNSMSVRSLIIAFLSIIWLLTTFDFQAEASTTTSTNPCPDVIAKKSYPGVPCRAFTIDFLSDGKTRNVQVFEIAKSRHRDDDLIYHQYGYLVELPGGKHLDLGKFRPFRGYPINQSAASQFYIASSLSINPALAGGLCCLRLETFTERILEEIHGRYCVTYSMIFPFQGSFRDCDGASTPEGAIGYGAGVISWQKAREIACERFKRDTNRPCKDSYHRQLSTRIVYKPNKSLHYITSFRRFIRKDPKKITTVLKPIKTTSTHVEYDHLVYRVDALSGDIELLETTKNDPDYGKWTNSSP